MNNTAPRELIFFLLRDFDANAQIIKNSYPFSLIISSKKFSVFVNETHDSGVGRSNDDECRIQINREQWEIAQEKSSIFLGYSNASNIFSVWEPSLINFRQNPSTFSIYSRFSKLEEAASSHYSIYKFDSKVLGKETFCLNFTPEYIGHVLNSMDTIWAFGGLNLDDIFMKNESRRNTELSNHSDKFDNQQKQKITVTTEQYERDPKFKSDVLSAYDNRCAICSIQMGIIEAAHVIPHSHDLGSDHIQNGIALCPNHHRMFDSGLIGLSETYKILVNWKRVEYLEKFKISEGTGDLKTIENSGIRLPVSTDAMPTADNIKTANKIRGVFWD